MHPVDCGSHRPLFVHGLLTASLQLHFDLQAFSVTIFFPLVGLSLLYSVSSLVGTHDHTLELGALW